MAADKRLSLVEHLDELRSRIIKCALTFLFCALVLYNYTSKIIAFFAKPVGRLVFIAPQEAFITYVRVALWGGLFMASPVIIYQLWRFISSGLLPKERKYVLIFAPFSFFLFVTGLGFGYFIIIPLGIRFLLGFGSELLKPMISVSSYISFVGMLMLIFGIIFQLPLMALFLTKLGIVTPQDLSVKRKHAVVGIFIVAAILTPPDIVTQVLMALPLMALYELGIVFSKLGYRKYNFNLTNDVER